MPKCNLYVVESLLISKVSLNLPFSLPLGQKLCYSSDKKNLLIAKGQLWKRQQDMQIFWDILKNIVCPNVETSDHAPGANGLKWCARWWLSSEFINYLKVLEAWNCMKCWDSAVIIGNLFPLRGVNKIPYSGAIWVRLHLSNFLQILKIIGWNHWALTPSTICTCRVH